MVRKKACSSGCVLTTCSRFTYLTCLAMRRGRGVRYSLLRYRAHADAHSITARHWTVVLASNSLLRKLGFYGSLSMTSNDELWRAHLRLGYIFPAWLLQVTRGLVKRTSISSSMQQNRGISKSSMGNLASTYRNQGRWKELRERILGTEHPFTSSSRIPPQTMGLLSESVSIFVGVH